MKLSAAGASVAVALTAMGIDAGMPLDDALEAAEDVVGRAQATAPAGALGAVEVRAVVEAMGTRINGWTDQQFAPLAEVEDTKPAKPGK